MNTIPDDYAAGDDAARDEYAADEHRSVGEHTAGDDKSMGEHTAGEDESVAGDATDNDESVAGDATDNDEPVADYATDEEESENDYSAAEDDSADDVTALDSESARDPNVITIDVRSILLPVAMVVMLVGGYWVGKQLGGRTNPEQVQVAAGATVVAQTGPLNPAPQELQVNPEDVQNQLDSQGVVPMPEPYHPLLGKPAPDFGMAQLADGKPVKLSDLRGKPVMINFWATWCPPCRMEMPWVQAVYDAHKDKGFVVLGVDAGERVAEADSNVVIKQFVDSMALTFPILTGQNNPEVQRQYSVYGLPSTFLVDRDGKVVTTHTGMYPNQATLESQVQAILSGG